MTKTPTLADLRRLAARVDPGVVVENDREGGAYRATAPLGKRFEPGLHELVSWYEGESTWMPSAREDLGARLADPTTSVEACDDPECDWCADARAEEETR